MGAVNIRISDARLDRIIEEDVPYIDLTTTLLGIDDCQGEIDYFTRESCVLCGTEEAARIMGRLGLHVIEMSASGTQLKPDDVFLRAQGTASQLHMAWKVCLNIFDHYSAVATKTAHMVHAAKQANESCEILTTRKSMPGAKDFLTKAVMTGGAFPHRLGLSETVLVFAHHTTFMGGFDAFVAQLPRIRRSCVEKKLFVEADAEQSMVLAKAGVDGIQFDKLSVEELTSLVPRLRAIDPHLTLIAAGGINPKNAGAYAATGVDGLATTAPFTAKPIDMSVRMKPIA
ncbi:MAG: ModD protein [Eggerthellaceae bacterium]|nr:ModD protein [Eggerthellaceae bacterium]